MTGSADPSRITRARVLLCAVCLLATLGCSTIRERIHLNKGVRLYKAQKYEAAIDEFQKILAFDGASWHANYMISISYLALYHPGSTHPKDVEYAEKAAASFKKLLAMDSPDAGTRDKVRAFYVNLLIGADKLDEAVAFFDELLAKEPNNLEYLSQAAQLYAKKGDADKALEYYQKRADADSANKEAWYTIGVVCWERSYRGSQVISNEERQKVIQRGFAAMEKALAIDPEYVPALSYVNLLYREQAKALVEVGDTQGAGNALLKADEYQKKSLAIMNRNRQSGGAAAAPAKAGA